MTTVKSTTSIRYHPHVAIDGSVIRVLKDAYQRILESEPHQCEVPASLSIPLRLLECFCDLTDRKITVETIQSPELPEILDEFTAALAGSSLANISSQTSGKYCRLLHRVFNEVAIAQHSPQNIAWNPQNLKPSPEIETRLDLACPSKKIYWAGFTISMQGKSDIHLRLAPLVRRHGLDFVQNIYKALRGRFDGSPSRNLFLWNKMFDFMAENFAQWQKFTFQSETMLRAFIQKFTRNHFEEAKRLGHDAKSQIRCWSRFLNELQDILCGTTDWAMITSPFKRPRESSKRGHETKTKSTADGMLYQEKLLTDIPLAVSDGQAMELLFHKIDQDVSIVKAWARTQATALYNRYKARTELARAGTAIQKYKGHFTFRLYSLADLCATVENNLYDVPNEFLNKVYSNVTGKEQTLKSMAYDLGIPLPGDLFAHQCLLVLEHPEITTSFLSYHELYNNTGAMTGYIAERNELIGYKKRKGPERSEQTIILTPESKNIFEQVISITTILRKVLRDDQNSNYRYSFLTSGNGFSPINRASEKLWNGSTFKNDRHLESRLINEFSEHCTASNAEIRNLIFRVKLTRIRVSRAVQIYLETRSADAMAKALGHESYEPALLSHYLPEPILAFIKSRWIRTFQKALVCEAMKESKHLLRAASFKNMDALHDFLERHRIKIIPEEAANPMRKRVRNENEHSEAAFSISTPLLSALFSLEAAVKGSDRQAEICGKAKYWSILSEKIKTEISLSYDRKLKSHAIDAMKLVDPNRMESVIYDTTHWV